MAVVVAVMAVAVVAVLATEVWVTEKMTKNLALFGVMVQWSSL